MKNLLIRNISVEDHLLVEAASQLGWTILATSSTDDPNEHDHLQKKFKNLEIVKRPTSFGTQIPSKNHQLTSNNWIKNFSEKKRIKIQLRTARYTKTNDLNLMISKLSPYLERFFPSYGLHWNKALYLRYLSKMGLSVPKILQVIHDQDEPRIDDESITYPCICKPAYCSGGKGIMVAHSKSDILRLFSYEKNPEHFTPINLFYRNRTKRGLRNYLHDSGHFHGPYILQQYIPGRIFSVSGAITDGQIQDFFAFEIHSTENAFCAEQAFSWPLSVQLEDLLKIQSQKMVELLKYPSGPFMADFVQNQEGELMIIDAAPRTSLTAVKMSFWVRQNNSHALSIVAAHSNEVFDKTVHASSQRPVYWQRFPFPKGKIKSIGYPEFQDPNLLFVETPLQAGQQIHEMRTDRQIAERGSLATTGKDLIECHSNWNKWYQKIQLNLE